MEKETFLESKECKISTNSVINWGIIGCGDVCEVKSGPAFYKAQGSRLVAVMRRDLAKAEDFAHRHSVSKWYDDVEKLLQDPEIDAVYIATPPGSHLELALKVCEARKACYVEKPMARCLEECKVMVDAFEQARLPLFVGYYRRYLRKFCAIKEAISSGALGTITNINIRLFQDRSTCEKELGWRVSKELAGGGIFLDLASHQIDFLISVFGALESVEGMASRVGDESDIAVENNVQMMFRTKDGALGSGSWSFCSSYEEDQFHIIGTNGHIQFAFFNSLPAQLFLKGETNGIELENSTPDHVHQPIVEELLQDLRRWKDSPQSFEHTHTSCSSTGRESQLASAIMDQVLMNYYTSRSIGFWNNKT